jgi:hypothetical protein
MIVGRRSAQHRSVNGGPVDGADLGGTRVARPPGLQNKARSANQSHRDAGLCSEEQVRWRACTRGRQLGNNNLGGDWFSRLGPAGTGRSLFIGDARSARRAVRGPARLDEGGSVIQYEGRPGDVGRGSRSRIGPPSRKT